MQKPITLDLGKKKIVLTKADGHVSGGVRAGDYKFTNGMTRLLTEGKGSHLTCFN